MKARAFDRPAAAGLVLAALALVAAPASAWQIDFEGLAKGTIVNEPEFGSFDLGAGLFAAFDAKRFNGLDNPAVVFDAEDPSGNDDDLAAPFTRLADGSTGFRPGNVLILQEGRGGCGPHQCNNPNDIGHRPAGAFFIDFNFDVTLSSIDFFDIEPEEDGEGEDNAILLYNSADEVIHTTYTPDTGGNNKWDRRLFLADGGEAVSGVRRVEIRMGGSGAIDNIMGSFGGSIMEPASLLLLVLGLAGLRAIPRRR